MLWVERLPLLARARRLTTLACALVAAARPARADPPTLVAPLGGGTPGPVRQLFLDPVLADARAVGTFQWDVRLESANSWSVPTPLSRAGRIALVQLDVEGDALALAMRIPWSAIGGDGAPWRRRVATTIRWRITAFWGGFEDGIIEGWHHLIGSYNFQRERYPRNRVNLVLADEGGAAAFDLRSGRIALGDVVLATQVLLAAGGASRVSGAPPDEPAWGVAARLDLKIPTGSLARAGGSGGVDGALAIAASAELARWAVLHGMAFGGFDSPFTSPIALQPRLFHAGADVSLVLLAGSWAFVLEDRFLSPLLEGGWTVLDGGDNGVYISSAYAALFRPHNQVTIGVRRGPIALSFSEDWTPGSNPRSRQGWFYNSNAPDTVLTLTITGRF